MKVERTIQLAASPERVYELVMDPARLEDWVTIHHRLEDAPDGKLEQGSKLTQWLKLAGQKFRVRWTVVENEPCEHVVWEGSGPVASRAKVEYDFAREDHGTRFTYLNEYHLPGGPLGTLAGKTVSRLTASALDGSLQRLRSLVE
jgi:uncharacterized protein YndB with AHSA1/START domain